ncbi:TPA: hypothetical protein SBQ34_000237 [Raoultella ornithinolytica]|jgi:coenzyme F420-reducing hydrogenase delta subunit|uniref:Uncharacterized protein n=1 Tax=Raoultella ornithinolytica TaxID=54291 RepID=A0ABZ2DSU3_RAOOR|nr:hypothetical protein [Raoultella ornithinolytica]HAT2280085.1 hypothetical protein [Raoultella ornithinolytica]HAT2344080.1 hypothetical protein [Raoultella ornithinolytica]HAT2401657.1 hypothetical protein [Raoultella ornithinolytica]HAT2436503.1 hypothetical protein [Raoultella ornithinolytica]
MSITVSRTITQQNSASALGIQIEESDGAVDVTYTAKSIVVISGDIATVEFETSVAGYAQTGIRHIDCPYSGGDNPLEEAEATLKLKIEEVDAEAAEIAAKKQMVAEQMELAEEMAKDVEEIIYNGQVSE